MNDTNEVYGIARCSTNRQDAEYEVNELIKKEYLKKTFL